MYSTILCFLIAVTIHVLAPTNPDAVWSAKEALYMATVFGATWLAVRSRMRRFTRSSLSEERLARVIRPRFTKIIQDNQTFLLLPFAIFTYATDYNSLVVAPFNDKSQAIAGVLGLLPYLLMWGVLWWESFPLKVVLFGTDDSRIGFVLSHARMEAAAVAPWFLLLAIGDLGAKLWPSGARFLDTHPIAQLFYAPLFLALAAIFMPVLVRRIWGCTPVPPGPLRDRLLADTASLGLKVREILFWPLLGGRLITAGIVGPLPRFRYLLITPALASLLDSNEMAAVVAHETGHVKHNHLWYYLLYFSGMLVGGLAIFFQLSSVAVVWWTMAFPEAAQSDLASSIISILLTLGMGVLIVVWFRILFGKLSRAFERQADLFSLEAMGRPGPITSALEAISAHSGDIRDLPSWHHGSVLERVNFISRAALDPQIAKAHHRSVKKLKKVTTVTILVLFAGAALFNLRPVEKAMLLSAAGAGSEFRLLIHPEDWRTFTRLGDVRMEAGRDKDALDAYLQAIRLNKDDYNALNNAAWLMSTSSDALILDPPLAVELAKRASELMPAPYILDTLAQALYKNGDRLEAVLTMRKILNETPENDPRRRLFEEKLERFEKPQ